MNLRGLTQAQVLASREKYGINQMPAPKLKSAWQFFIEVFQDKLNLILLFMMLIFIGLGISGYGSVSEAIGIGIVLVVVATTTVWTKLKTQRSAEQLRLKSSQMYANVIRDGIMHRVDSVDVVVGDIVVIAAGETICADGYLIDGAVSVNNAILNGESTESDKTPVAFNYKYNRNAPINADSYVDAHLVFSGTTVLSGEGKMCVTRVGADTENAKIMTSLNAIDEVKTTLQIQLDNLAAQISKIGSICAVVIFGVLLAVNLHSNGVDSGAGLIYTIFSSLTVALTIFIAAVPEGLPFIIGIITGQNVNTMIKNNILAKNPHKIPEAGNIQILCTDKTGTLTRGFLQPIHNFIGDGIDMAFDQVTGNRAKEMFIEDIALVSGVTYGPDGDLIGGNMTSRSLFESMRSYSDFVSKLQQNVTIDKKIAFNSANKFSAAHTTDGLSYFMGAPEVILSHAKTYIDENGAVQKLNKTKINNLIKKNASRAMRLVATAYSPNGTWCDDEVLPDDLVFISLIAMRDDVRPGVPDVVRAMNKSGVQVMMITGDILDTARAIAIDCDIITSDNDIAITASELDNMSDTDALEVLSRIRVIARATPATKLRIVKLAQSLNLCIGMCGDGTNDAPALKRADVGFAMGDGTDVCKESSDIIITDNNFISIANSILLGRTFVHNVKSFLKFQLPINFALVVLSVLFPVLFGFDAFTAVQILIINIVMDSLNSLAFGGEPSRPEYMTEPAQGKNAPLISRSLLSQVLWSTIGFVAVFGILALPSVRGYFDAPSAYMSARFALLVIMAIINGFCVRVDGFNLFARIRSNPMFIMVAIGVVATTMFCVTFGGSILQLSPLSPIQWVIVFALALLIIPINFVRLALRRAHAA